MLLGQKNGARFRERRLGTLSLEHQFQSKLHLPCASKVSRRKSRGNDLVEIAEGCRRSRQYKVGVAEVRMIEEVEHFRPELQLEELRDLCVLRDGEICGHKAGAGDCVSAQVAKGSTGSR